MKGDLDKKEELYLQEGSMPYQVHLKVVPVGSDLVVLVWGGEKPHVGAVAVAVPRPSLDDPQITSSTTSVYAMVGHKEDDLAKDMAAKLAAKFKKNIILTAGIHIDNIPPQGIKAIEDNCKKILENLLSCYGSEHEGKR